MQNLALAAYLGGEGHDMGTAAWIGLGIIAYAGFIFAVCLIAGANGRNRGE